MVSERIAIPAAEGNCPALFAHPDGAGPWPAVLMFMDGPGYRPAIEEMAERLAGEGFAVLLPDLFYRSGPYAPVDPKTVFTDPVLKEQHRANFMARATPKAVMADTALFLDWLAARAEVAPGPVGVTGYCMGGRLALIAAGTFPGRIGAAASYHGGGLANDTPASPHLLAGRMGKVYVGGAREDPNFDDAQKARLIAAFVEAGTDAVVETYPAKHGWVPRDTAVHSAEEAEHHWRTLVPFMRGALDAG